MSEKKLRLALLGLGKWGTNIANTLRVMPQVGLMYAGNDATEVPEVVDGVLIATPGSTHAATALPFIQKGIPTFIEKPMTTSLADAKKLAAAAKKSGSRVFAGHIHLYNPAYIKAKELIKQAGKLRYLYFEGANNGPFRDDMSAMWDWAPHDVALALDLIGSLPASVQAWEMYGQNRGANLNDGAVIKLHWPQLNLDVLIMVSSLFPEKRKKMIAVCDQPTVVFDDIAHTVTQTPGVQYQVFDMSKTPLQLELEAFIDCIINKQQPISDINQGLAVVKILSAAEKSITLDGRKVKV